MLNVKRIAIMSCFHNGNFCQIWCITAPQDFILRKNWRCFISLSEYQNRIKKSLHSKDRACQRWYFFNFDT